MFHASKHSRAGAMKTKPHQRTPTKRRPQQHPVRHAPKRLISSSSAILVSSSIPTIVSDASLSSSRSKTPQNDPTVAPKAARRQRHTSGTSSSRASTQTSSRRSLSSSLSLSSLLMCQPHRTFRTVAKPSSLSSSSSSLHATRHQPSVITLAQRGIRHPALKAIQEFLGRSSIFGLYNPFRSADPHALPPSHIPASSYIRTSLIIAGACVAGLAGAYMLFRFVIFAVKVGIVALALHFAKNFAVKQLLQRGELEKAVFLETWGGSHKNDSIFAKVLYHINPMTWPNQIFDWVMNADGMATRRQEIASLVTTQLSADRRMQEMFGNEYIIGKIDFELSEHVSQSDEHEQNAFDGVIAIPIYALAPQVLDISNDDSNTNQQKHSDQFMGGRYKDPQEMFQAILKDVEKEVGESHIGPFDLARMASERADAEYEKAPYDPHGDRLYPYKYYIHHSPAREKAAPQVYEDDQSSKRAFFLSECDKQRRIDRLDYVTLTSQYTAGNCGEPIRSKTFNQWANLRKPSPDMTEIGVVLAYYNSPGQADFAENIQTTGRLINLLNPFAMTRAFTSKKLQLQQVVAMTEKDTKTLFDVTQNVRWQRIALLNDQDKLPDHSLEGWISRHHDHTANLHDAQVYEADSSSSAPTESQRRAAQRSAMRDIVEPSIVEASVIDDTPNNSHIVEASYVPIDAEVQPQEANVIEANIVQDEPLSKK